jgi:hypothetical protein
MSSIALQQSVGMVKPGHVQACLGHLDQRGTLATQHGLGLLFVRDGPVAKVR